MPSPGGLRSGAADSDRRAMRGEGEDERCAGTAVMLGVGFGVDGAVVLEDDGAADGETEAGAAFLAGVRGFDLAEAVEDGVELVDGDAAALVSDAKGQGLGAGLGGDGDRRADGGELDGVGEEVGEDLEDAVGVARQRRRGQRRG